MSIEQHIEDYTASERETFQRACRRLLKQTFIVRDRNEESRKLYFFISKNPTPFSEYFQLIGFDVVVDRNNGVIMLSNYGNEEDGANVQSNRLWLKKDESVILCCLWIIYIDRLNEGNLTRPILISVTDLRFELEKFGVRDEVDKAVLRRALDLFSRYQLIELSGKVGDEECLIRLYPSLAFALNTEEFKKFVDVTVERMKGISKGEMEEGEDEEDENGEE
ncbi:MAG: DUF4194 domain-containing protein [Clostridium sp.]|nr:DUF4194 domain-containing protein [Clostridium sp.]